MCLSLLFFGAPGGIRTPNPQIRSSLRSTIRGTSKGEKLDFTGFSPFLFRLIPCRSVSLWKQMWKQNHLSGRNTAMICSTIPSTRQMNPHSEEYSRFGSNIHRPNERKRPGQSSASCHAPALMRSTYTPHILITRPPAASKFLRLISHGDCTTPQRFTARN